MREDELEMSKSVKIGIAVLVGVLSVSVTSDLWLFNRVGRLEIDLSSLNETHRSLLSEHKDLQTEHEELQVSYDQLDANLSVLRVDYETLSSRHERLKTTYEELEQEHQDLQEEHDKLGEEYNSLTQEYEQLGEEHERLGEEHEKLGEEYGELAEEKSLLDILKMPRGLDEHYDQLRNVHWEGAGGWAIYQTYKDMNAFFCSIVLHDSGQLYYSRTCRSFLEDRGEWCFELSYDLLHDLVDFVAGGKRGVEKVRAIYEWVVRSVEYEYDVYSEYPRFPLETLVHGIGDCEDQAMALAALLEVAGFETAVCAIVDRSRDFGHAFIMVKLSQRDAGVSWTLPRYEEMGDVWKMLDPAFEHDFYDLPTWVESLYTRSGGEIRVPDSVWDQVIVDFHELVAYQQSP